MKKKYEKADIVFQSFVLSAAVASGGCGESGLFSSTDACSMVANSGSPETCKVDDGGFSIFSDLSMCDMEPADEQACYHVPTDDTKMFSS